MQRQDDDSDEQTTAAPRIISRHRAESEEEDEAPQEEEEEDDELKEARRAAVRERCGCVPHSLFLMALAVTLLQLVLMVMRASRTCARVPASTPLPLRQL